MADKLKKSNPQQQEENVDEPEQKRQKPNECKSEAEVIEPKAITNIYYDCLERIFDFLDLKSLLMVARTCKRLQIAAAAKFGDEYGDKKIWLYPIRSVPMVLMQQSDIEVYGLKFCLTFLRCFGAKISDLVVRYNRVTNATGNFLDKYINQYCADTLTSIKFRDKLQFSNEAFLKPFKNVEEITIKWCNVGNQLPNFVNWFPNVLHLELERCSFDESALINVHFPHLEHLNIYDSRIKNAANLLQANPQLQSLKIQFDSKLTMSRILNAINTNALIRKLEVVLVGCIYMMTDVKMAELNRFAVEHPLVEHLILRCHCFTANGAINFVRRMNALKRIEFRVMGRPECDRLTNRLDGEWKSEVSNSQDIFFINLNR